MDYLKRQGDPEPAPNESSAIQKVDHHETQGVEHYRIGPDSNPQDADQRDGGQNHPPDSKAIDEPDSGRNSGRDLFHDPSQDAEVSAYPESRDDGKTWCERDSDSIGASFNRSDLPIQDLDKDDDAQVREDGLFDLYDEYSEAEASVASDCDMEESDDRLEHETGFPQASGYPDQRLDDSADEIANRFDGRFEPGSQRAGNPEPEVGPHSKAESPCPEMQTASDSAADSDWVFDDNTLGDFDFDFVQPIVGKPLASSGVDDSVASGAGQDSEPTGDSRYIENVYDPWSEEEYENAFFQILNEETGQGLQRSGDDPAGEDQNARFGFHEPQDDRIAPRVAVENLGEAEDDMDPRVSLSSGFTAVDSSQTEDIPLSAGNLRATKEPAGSSMPGNFGRSAADSNDQEGNSEALNIHREEDVMTWLAKGLVAILTIVVAVMGGFVYNLQSQIDELHLLLPLDRESPFSGAVRPASDPANQAVIDNINARIDNLADTLELIAVANQQLEQVATEDVENRPGSGAAQGDSGRAANRVASVLAGRAEIGEINLRIDRLEKAFEEIRRTVPQPQSPAKEIAARDTVEVYPDSPVADRALPSDRTEIKHEPPVRTDETRPKQTVTKQPLKPVSTSSVPKAPRKPRVQGEWSVNLMSLTEKAIAEREQERFRMKGVTAEIKPARISGRTWYRLRVGGFNSRQDAQKFAESAKKKLGLASAWVTH